MVLPEGVKPYTGLWIDDVWVEFPKDFQTVSLMAAINYAVRAKKGMPHDQILAEMQKEAEIRSGKPAIKK